MLGVVGGAPGEEPREGDFPVQRQLPNDPPVPRVQPKQLACECIFSQWLITVVNIIISNKNIILIVLIILIIIVSIIRIFKF